MVGQRKRLLTYLSKHDLTGYRALIEKLGLPIDTITRYALHEGKLVNQTAAALASQWRTLFAQAVIKLEHHESLKDLA